MRHVKVKAGQPQKEGGIGGQEHPKRIPQACCVVRCRPQFVAAVMSPRSVVGFFLSSSVSSMTCLAATMPMVISMSAQKGWKRVKFQILGSQAQVRHVSRHKHAEACEAQRVHRLAVDLKAQTEAADYPAHAFGPR